MLSVVWSFLCSLFKRPEEPRIALPIGITEFTQFSEACLTSAAVPGLTQESGYFAVASILMSLPATESTKPISYFAHALRKAAVNETAYNVIEGLKRAQKEKAEAAKAAAAVEVPVSTPQPSQPPKLVAVPSATEPTQAS